MKTLFKLLVVMVMIGAAANSVAQSNTQSYNTAIGFRAGGLTSGITFKHFTSPDVALEGIASWGYRSFIFTGLYEQHQSINNAPGLLWFYGGGGHIGFFQEGGYYYVVGKHGHYIYAESPGSSAVVGGLDFILGLDYKFNKAPFNIGMDIKPIFDFYGGVNAYFDGAISFRFAF